MKLFSIVGKEKGGWSNRSIINVLANDSHEAIEVANIDTTKPYDIKEVGTEEPRILTVTRT